MKQYYIYLDNNQIGPLKIEDLKQYTITSETLVWYDGLAEWQKAGMLQEIKMFIKAVPPPIQSFTSATPPPVIQKHDYNKPSKILGIRKNTFIYSILGLAFIICISAFSSYENEGIYEDEMQSMQIESYNLQIQEQQKAIDEQNIRIAEQERVAKENKIKQLSDELDIANQNLEVARKQLHDVSAFQLLRSTDTRHEEVSAAEEEVRVWENEIVRLERGLRNINS